MPHCGTQWALETIHIYKILKYTATSCCMGSFELWGLWQSVPPDVDFLVHSLCLLLTAMKCNWLNHGRKGTNEVIQHYLHQLPLGLTLTFVAQGHDLMLEEKEPAVPAGPHSTTGKMSGEKWTGNLNDIQFLKQSNLIQQYQFNKSALGIWL